MTFNKLFYVHLSAGPPWGFRLRGGRGSGNALVISRVNSLGRDQGLREGDRVVGIGGRATAHLTLGDAHKQLKEAADGIEMQIQRCVRFAETSDADIQNGNAGVPHLNALQDITHAGSWSTDSTSTGSTTIHVSSLHADDTTDRDKVWSPISKKRANLHLNLNHCITPVRPLQHPDVSETPGVVSVRTCEARTSEARTTEVRTTSCEAEGVEEESSPVWQPFGAPYDGPPAFRPVKMEVATKTTITSHAKQNGVSRKPVEEAEARCDSPRPTSAEVPRETSSPLFTKSGWSSHLPPSQSPTVTLLQKAREGQLPKGAIYIDEKFDSIPLPKNAVLIDQKVSVEGDKVHTDSFYAVPTLTTETSRYDVKTPPKYDGIGPTEYGIPVGLRTGVKEEHASDWYKTMYKSLHKNKFPNDTGQVTHPGGYMSEPEFERKDKLRAKHEHRRKPEKIANITHTAEITKSSADSSVVRREPGREVYRVQPGSIAEYVPGRSSLAEKEFQKFWSDFWDSMDDLQQEHLGNSPAPRQGLYRRWQNTLLSDGYESDSTLIRKTGRNPEVDPDQQKAWYKEIQKGGEIPLTGLRKSVPDKPTASPHQYQETEVNIHFRSPIRNLEREHLEEEELKRRHEDTMRRLTEEERRRKHQLEVAEIEMRKHSDFFTPSQKSPILLNRYDNPFDPGFTNRLAVPGSNRGPPPKTMARTLYPFSAKTNREVSLSKGDIVYICKQVDKNWFEGEHHGLVGIFPVSYVEIIPNEKAHLQPRKATEGEALVKFNFRAQNSAELSLFKGERVVLLRRVDANWFEGRLAAKRGIFPVSYVHVLREPGEVDNAGTRSVSPRPHASPVYSPILSSSSSRHLEAPTFTTSLRPLQDKPPLQSERRDTVTQTLHIDTYNEPIPYRALYGYVPQNEDELELRAGDTAFVMEQCDDGWYVGTSLRSGLFGTFPGNYVERI